MMHLNFVHISDTHLHPDPNRTGDLVDFTAQSTVPQLIETINNLPYAIDFVLHTGDIIHEREHPEHYAFAKEMLAKIDAPVYYLTGNHDHADSVQIKFHNRTPQTLLPRHDFRFSVNGFEVIALDSTRPDSPNGHVTEAQLTWLKDMFTTNDTHPLIIAIHHNALPTGAPWLDTMQIDNGQELHKVLLHARDRIRGVFYGHVHENIITTRNGINYYSVRSGWLQTRTWYGQINPANEPQHPLGFNLVTLTDDTTYVRPVTIVR